MAFLLLALSGLEARAAVTLKIDNLSGANIWVMWTDQAGGASGLTGSSGTTSIASSEFGINAAGYSLSSFAQDASGAYVIDGFSMNGGRMWFTYGDSSWQFADAGYRPAVATFNDPNITRRYDKVEAFIQGSTDDNLDITAVDAFSIPFQITAYNSAHQSTTTQILRGSPGDTIIQALSAVAADKNAATPTSPGAATPAQQLPHLDGNSPYLVLNTNSQGLNTAAPYQYSPYGSSGAFVRVIANDNLVTPGVEYMNGNTVERPADPIAAANGGAVPQNYNWLTFNSYLRRMDGRGTNGSGAGAYAGTTTIKGNFAGLSHPTTPDTYAATYNLTASFSPTESRSITYTIPPPPTGPMPPGTGPGLYMFTSFVTLNGSSTITAGPDSGKTYNIELKIPYGSLPEYITEPTDFPNPHAFLLDPSGAVGANANYLFKYYLSTETEPADYSQTNPFGGGPQNDVMTWALGDLLSGLNVGSLGSETKLASALTLNGNLYPAGTEVGAMNSQDWWSLGTALRGTDTSSSVYDYYFDYLQSNPDYYNTYAEAIYPHTDAYGFAYSDRIADGRAAISWDATQPDVVDTVVITILPDAVTVPEPTSALLFLGASAVVVSVARRRKVTR